MREFLDLILAELRGGWRYRWLAINAAWLICLGGWAAVYMMPDSYESQAVVLFDTTSELNELLESLTVNADLLTRVEIVQTALLGRQQLEEVARETDLYLRAEDSQSMEGLLNELRSRLTITSDQRRGANIYRLSYRDEDPSMAYSVVNALLNNFVEQTIGANRAGTQRAQQFLRDELQALESDLTDAERRLADFKRENVGRIPGESGDYFGRLQTEMAELEDIQSQLRQANRRRDTLRQQLSGEQPTIDAAGGPQTELDVRIQENERRLEELRLRFTDRHPDVIAVISTLEQLREQKEEQLRALQRTDGVGVASDNPVYQNIQIELSKINVEIASLEEQERASEDGVAELRELIDVLPQIEAELARLNRDYDVKLATYRALLQRLEIAELSESAERSEDVSFQIIDPPLEPINPVGPNRPLFLFAILVVGLGTGAASAFVANQLFPVFTDPRTLREATGLPVLGAVAIVKTREAQRQRSLRVGLFGASVAALCVVFVAVFLFHDPASRILRALV